MENNDFIEELKKDAPELEAENNILPLKRDGLFIRLRANVMDKDGKPKFTQITINSHPLNMNDTDLSRQAIAETLYHIYDKDSTTYDVIIEDYESLESFVEGEKQKNFTPDFKNPKSTTRKSGFITLLGVGELSSLHCDLDGQDNPLYQSLVEHLNLDTIHSNDILSQDEAGYLGCFSYSNKEVIAENNSNTISNFKDCNYSLNENIKDSVANILNSYHQRDSEEASRGENDLGPVIE